MTRYVPNRNVKKEVEQKLGKALDRSAVIYQKEVKQQLSGPRTNKRLGVKTGHLRRSIQIEKTGKLSRRVGTNVKYAKIHEFGGVIKALTAKLLRFKIAGNWFSKESVIIPARPFMRPSFKKRKKDMMKQFKDIL